MHTVNLFVFRVVYFLFASFILQISTVYALPVASYIEVPKSYQLYPRDIGSMTAQVRFAGTVTDTTGFNTFEIIVKRDGQPYQTVLLPVISGVNFNFDQTFSIVAELKSYSFVVRMKNYANQYRVLTNVNEVVAGDAILIYGQSNAQAIGRPGSICASDSQIHPYVRTVGTNQATIPIEPGQWNWGIGAEGGLCPLPANTLPIGQWAVVMGKLLVTQTQIPLLLINGAIGGKTIAYLSEDAPYDLPVGTNVYEWLNAYDRLFSRAKQAKAANKIKTVIWWQGESDTYPVATPYTAYINATQLLHQSLQISYPNMQHFIMVQQRGWTTNKTTTSPPIQDAQRVVASLISGAHILPSNGLAQHVDKLHYDFVNGYETLGQNMAQLVGYLEYPSVNSPSFNSYTPSPRPISITPNFAAKTLTISHNSGLNLMVQSGVLSNKFRLEGLNGPLTTPVLQSVTINALGQIVLTYNGNINNAVGLTYLSNLTGTSPEVREINGNRALLSFYKFPIN